MVYQSRTVVHHVTDGPILHVKKSVISNLEYMKVCLKKKSFKVVQTKDEWRAHGFLWPFVFSWRATSLLFKILLICFMKKNFLRITGVANVVSAVSLLLYWFLYAILLPLNEVPTNYHLLILDPSWLFVNVLGVIGFVLALIGILGLFFKQYNDLTWYGIVGFLITFVGQIFYNAGLYYETFIWPILAESDPSLITLATGPI